MHQLVILDDKLSDWESKGEIVRGYFNPGGIFTKITIVSLIKDTPSPEIAAFLAAPAEATHVSLGFDRLDIAVRTLGLHTRRLKTLFKPLYQITRTIQPDMVRCFGESLGTVAAYFIHKELNVPYVVSLHQTSAPHIIRRYLTTKDKIWRKLMTRNVHRALAAASGIVAVYSPVLEHLPPQVRSKAVVIPNIVATPTHGSGLAATEPLASEFRILWVSRLIPGREPFPIIEAISLVQGATLTIVGDGPLRAHIEQKIDTLNISDRVKIIPSMNNADLVNMMPSYDIMALRTQFLEISKPILEAGLAGIPVVINRKPCSEIPEYDKLPIMLVDDNPAAYAGAFQRLKDDSHLRAKLSKDFREQAWLQWNPQTIGKRMSDFLTKTISASKGHDT